MPFLRDGRRDARRREEEDLRTTYQTVSSSIKQGIELRQERERDPELFRSTQFAKLLDGPHCLSDRQANLKNDLARLEQLRIDAFDKLTKYDSAIKAETKAALEEQERKTPLTNLIHKFNVSSWEALSADVFYWYLVNDK